MHTYSCFIDNKFVLSIQARSIEEAKTLARRSLARVLTTQWLRVELAY